ncbi:hypothetical protein [Paraoerskovia sediminicola]|uniref:hypothetical protein n=1 Tax=Paraoerskovia sediminicola TaxID=1138587 RepID=UPI002573A43D|nr:hypothetical protein [Paraoerskovia sediminicola]
MGENLAPPAAPALGGRLAVFVASAGVLSVALPLLLVAEIDRDPRSTAWTATLALVVWAGFRLSYRIASGRPELFDFVFWVFCYIFMGVAPSVQILTGGVSTTTPGVDPSLDIWIAGTVWTGVVCYEIGRWITRRRRTAWASVRVDAATGLDVVPRRAVLLTGVGVVAAAYFVSKIGLGTLFMSRYSAADIRGAAMPDLAVRSIVSAAASYPLLIAACVFILVGTRSALGSRSWRYAPLLAIVLVVLLTVTNPISSARYDFGTVGFALVVAAGAMSTVRRARWSMVGVLLALLFVFPIADAFRADAVNVQRTGFFAEYAGNPDYDAFWQIGNAVAYVRDDLVQPMMQALGVVFFWVPRSIWPGKPLDTGVMLAQYRGYSFENLSAPLWAEALVNGGFVVVVIGFVALGMILALLDEKISVALVGRGQFWSVVGAVFPFYMVILLRGSLLQATGTLVVALACTLFVREWKREKRQRDRLDAPVVER